MALRTSSGRFCQKRARKSVADKPPGSCVFTGAIIVFARHRKSKGSATVPHRASIRTHTETLRTGQSAPLFSLPDADMERVDLAKFRGKQNVVLYFYPRDGTPGCTLQATEFSDHEGEFARCDTVVLGVSPDDCLCHAEFSEANGVSIRLLADTECEVCEMYGVLETNRDARTDGASTDREARKDGSSTAGIRQKGGATNAGDTRNGGASAAGAAKQREQDGNNGGHGGGNGSANGNGSSGAGGGRLRGITRATFVIDKRGVVRHALYNVNPRGHAMEVLSLVKALGA
jgi:peroxiredoxin